MKKSKMDIKAETRTFEDTHHNPTNEFLITAVQTGNSAVVDGA
ncbi:hypothetical protein [Acetobacterium wieringae]|nr:hypothetical protein [Acetobacterium wieringae]